jgi:hypothetical protein
MSGINAVGPVRMKLYKAYTPLALRQIGLYINIILVKASPGFNDDCEDNYLVWDINELGNVKIEIKNTKSVQIIIDDIEWFASNQVLYINIKGFVIYPSPVNSDGFRIASVSRA